MPSDAVKVVQAFQPPLGFDLTSILQRNASAEAVADAMAGFRGYVTDDFVAAYYAAGEGEAAGVDGLREIWLEWMSPWESYRTLQHRFVELPDGRVAVLAKDSGRRHDSTEEIEVHGMAIYTVRGNRIARAEYYARVEDGLAAAGLKPPS